MVVSHHPHSITKETPFTMVYGFVVMLSIEIDTPTWRCSQFSEEENETKLRYIIDLIDETRDVAHIMEFSTSERPEDITQK